MGEGRTQAVGTPWAVRINRESALAAGLLRLHPGVEVLEEAESIWIRGSALTEAVDLSLRKIAPRARYAVQPDGGLLPMGRRIPTGRLPQGVWVPIGQYLVPQPQPAALPGDWAAVQNEACLTLSVHLVQAASEEEPTMLVTELAAWADYAVGAPAVRLHPLRFAADSTRVLIWGRPLPPLPGVRYTETSGIAVPCGFTYTPHVDAGVLRSLLQLADGEVALFNGDGSYERIAASAFVQANRLSVRLTLRGARP